MAEKKNKASVSGRDLEQMKILAVRAAEENSKRIFPPMALSGANISAIGSKSDEEFISRRASHLFDMLPEAMQAMVKINRFPGNWIRLTVLISFIIGLLSNYLGPSRLIHVVYNPLTILLVWNLLIYILMVLKAIWKPTVSLGKYREKHSRDTEDKPVEEEKANGNNDSRFLIDRIIGSFYRGIIRLRARYIDDSTRATFVKKIVPDFWSHYRKIAGRSLFYRFKCLSNASAASLLTGAVAGVYFRGLFFQYNIIWQSTFVSEPETIRRILNIFFGPASLLINGKLIGLNEVTALLSETGTLAGPWIHLMVLTVFLAIFLPRTILAVYYYVKSLSSMGRINYDDSYYRNTVLKNRESLIGIIKEGIREIITKKINKISRTIAEFVIRDYYQKIIEPILVRFREKGGKIRKLEEELFASQEQFEPILLNYLKEVQEEFRSSILTETNLFLGRKLNFDIDTFSTYQPRSDEIDRRLPGRIAEDIGDTIGGTIVTTVSLAAGAVSGGIGKSLGIAIISGLLGVSGPVGLLIGGVITAITLGGFYQVKREKISGMVKDIPLPPVVTSVTLTESRIEKGRKETRIHTESEIRKMLTPKIDEVTDTILRDMTY